MEYRIGKYSWTSCYIGNIQKKINVMIRMLKGQYTWEEGEQSHDTEGYHDAQGQQPHDVKKNGIFPLRRHVLLIIHHGGFPTPEAVADQEQIAHQEAHERPADVHEVVH